MSPGYLQLALFSSAQAFESLLLKKPWKVFSEPEYVL